MQFVKSLLPDSLIKFLRPIYHGFLAWWGSVWFGNPSDKLVVFGVTGTNGKSTTVNLIAHILETSGLKTGFVSTVNYNFGEHVQLNSLKMTMPSGFLLQKWMKKMLRQGCKCVVLEVSSEGLAQNRHAGIRFDVAVFTNLTPEHIESHGSFEQYKLAKLKLFQAVSRSTVSAGKKSIVTDLKKTIVTNTDDPSSPFYAAAPADVHLTYGIRSQADFQAPGFKSSLRGLEFDVNGVHYHSNLLGKFDVYNLLAAMAATSAVGIDLETCQKAVASAPPVPGRMELLQEQPFTVLVDYAPEPFSLKALYETLESWPRHRLIHVLGSTGGGRDRARRKVLGRMAGETADIVIVTNEDPYDDDPLEIIREVAAGALSVGKITGKNLYIFADRRAAINKALHLAMPGDLVLVTGKGSEQKMAVAGGRYIDWDDRKVLREELKYREFNEQKNRTSDFEHARQ